MPVVVGTPRTKTGKSKKKGRTGACECLHSINFNEDIPCSSLQLAATLSVWSGWYSEVCFWRIVTHVLNRRTQIAGQLERFSVFHVAPSYRKNFLCSYLKYGTTFAARGAWGGVIRRTFKHVIFSMIIKQKLTHLFIGVHNTSTSHDSQFSRGF